MPSVKVIYMPGNSRSMMLCRAMAQGAEREGYYVRQQDFTKYRRPDADIAVFYGAKDSLADVLRDYPAAGRHTIFMDLAYWGRQFKGLQEYHKVVVNGRHPTAYFQKVKHPDDRVKVFGLRPKRWTHGRHILLCGMSKKGSISFGYQPQEWERAAIAEIRKHSQRSIIYRPKPSCRESPAIAGVRFSPPTQKLSSVLTNCHAVVTRHSNTAVDALLAGVPVFCWDGVGQPMGLQDLSRIEDPIYPEGRDQWLADVAYCQWTLEEMLNGTVWRHLKSEGLIP